MSNPENLSAQAGVAAPVIAQRALWAIILSTLGIVALIWSEIWLTLAAAIWSFVQLLGVGMPGYVVLSLALTPVALWASWQTARLAWNGERNGSD